MKVPKPRKLPSGMWNVTLQINGKRMSITEPTEKRCSDKARLLKAEHLSGKRIARISPLTVSQAIDKHINETILSPSTVRGYRQIQKLYFQDLMKKPLSSDLPWKAAVKDMAAKYSAKTVRNAWGVIATILKENKMEVPDVHLPQNIGNERPYLTEEQLKTFLVAIIDTPYEMEIYILLSSARRSEALAIDWENVEIENKRIKISGAMVINEHSQYVFKKENKTKKSARYLPIMSPRLLELLEKNKKPSGKLVTVHPNTITRNIKSICIKNGLPPCGSHSMRHTFATLARKIGLDEKDTAAIGGWADLGTMRNIYQHEDEKEKLEAQNKMSEWYNQSYAQ